MNVTALWVMVGVLVLLTVVSTSDAREIGEPHKPARPDHHTRHLNTQSRGNISHDSVRAFRPQGHKRPAVKFRDDQVDTKQYTAVAKSTVNSKKTSYPSMVSPASPQNTVASEPVQDPQNPRPEPPLKHTRAKKGEIGGTRPDNDLILKPTKRPEINAKPGLRPDGGDSKDDVITNEPDKVTTTTTMDPFEAFCQEACKEGVGGPECNCPGHPIGRRRAPLQ